MSEENNMKKKIHLVCNAHLDPVWLWQWEDGAAEAVSTYRIAADFCEEEKEFVFNCDPFLVILAVPRAADIGPTSALIETIRAKLKSSETKLDPHEETEKVAGS